MTQQVPETACAYLAGMIDGDGYISISRALKANNRRCQPMVYHCLKVGIAGTDQRPHALASEYFGGNIAKYKPKNPRHKVQYQWSLSGPSARAFLRSIRKFLLIKAQQADIGMDFQDALEDHVRQQRISQNPPYRITKTMLDEREVFWKQMSTLNSPRVGKKAAGRLLDGVEHSEFPR